MNRSLFRHIVGLIVLAGMLAACTAPAAPTAAPAKATEAPTAAPAEATEAPTAAPTESYSIENPMGKRPAAWSDEVTDCTKCKKDPPWTIGVSNYSLGNSWRVQMMAELEAAAKRDPRIKELIITNADQNLAKQVSDIEDLKARGVDAMLITPLSADGLAPVVEELYNAGIPTIIFNNEIATSKFHSIVWVDEFKFGYIGGKWLNDKLGGKGNVVVLDGMAGTSTSELRAAGAMAAFGPDIKVLAKQPADWAYDKGKAVMEDFIAAYPQIDGIYSQGGAMSQGALEALLAAGKPLVPVTGEGYNGFLKFWDKNKDSGFSSIGPDEPTWQSVEALNQAIACLEGKQVDKWHELPLPTITDQNLKDYVRTDCPDDVWANTKMTRDEIGALYKCSGQ